MISSIRQGRGNLVQLIFFLFLIILKFTFRITKNLPDFEGS